MDDKNLQRQQLDKIYVTASFPPVFRINPKYFKGEFEGMTPYVSYADVMGYKFIIRGTLNIENKSERNPIIVQYDSMDDLINDGWRLD